MQRLLFKLARKRFFIRVLVWMLVHMSFAIPVNRLRETDTLLAFFHPQPSYPFHVLILPKRPYASLDDLPAEDCPFLSDLVRTVQDLVSRYQLGQSGYRLIANGGSYQEIALLHFHLVSEK